MVTLPVCNIRLPDEADVPHEETALRANECPFGAATRRKLMNLNLITSAAALAMLLVVPACFDESASTSGGAGGGTGGTGGGVTGGSGGVATGG